MMTSFRILWCEAKTSFSPDLEDLVAAQAPLLGQQV